MPPNASEKTRQANGIQEGAESLMVYRLGLVLSENTAVCTSPSLRYDGDQCCVLARWPPEAMRVTNQVKATEILQQFLVFFGRGIIRATGFQHSKGGDMACLRGPLGAHMSPFSIM